MSEPDKERSEATRKLFKECVERITRFNDQAKVGEEAEIIALVETALPRFPSSQEEDLLFPKTELEAFLGSCDRALLGWDFSDLLKRNETLVPLAKGFLHYFERNGPGTPYLKSFKVFRMIIEKDIQNCSRPQRASDVDAKFLDEVMTSVLGRVPSLPEPDCIAMLSELRILLARIHRLNAFSFNNASYLKQRKVLLCQIIDQDPQTDPDVSVRLFRLANELCNSRVTLAPTGPSRDLCCSLVDLLQRSEYPNEVKLKIIGDLFTDNIVTVEYASKLLSCGVESARQVSNEQADKFLGNIEGCLDPLMNNASGLGGQVNDTLMPALLGTPEAILLLEEMASPENLGSVKCLLHCLDHTLKKSLTRQLPSEAERRLISKVVQLFSQPSVLTNQRLEEISFRISRLIVSTIHEYTEPLVEMWISQLVDSRFSWSYRALSATKLKRLVDSKPEHVRAKLINNFIWISDPSRCLPGDGASERERSAADSLSKSAPRELRDDYDVSLILLLTLMRAPSVLERLRNKSELTCLPQDILRKLAMVLGAKFEDD